MAWKRPLDVFDYDKQCNLDLDGRRSRLRLACKQLAAAEDAGAPENVLNKMREKILWPPVVEGPKYC